MRSGLRCLGREIVRAQSGHIIVPDCWLEISRKKRRSVIRRWFTLEAAKRQGAEYTSDKAAWMFEAVLTQSYSGTQGHFRATNLNSTTNLMVMTSTVWISCSLDILHCDIVRGGLLI